MESDYEALWESYKKSVDNGGFSFTEAAYSHRWELFARFGQAYAHHPGAGQVFLLTRYPELTRFMKAAIEKMTVGSP